MSGSTLFKSPATRLAAGALAVALALLAWAVVRAMRADPLPPATPAAIAGIDKITGRVPRGEVDLQAAVDNDVFAVDRTPPPGSYRMPGEADPGDKPVVEVQKPVVLGTAVATDGRSFATVRLGDASPKLVRVGDKIGEWVVRAIDRGKVTLVSAAGVRTDVTVPKTGT